jgi:hypothetical protein
MRRIRRVQAPTAHSSRLRDAAVVVPLLGLFAWMPPMIGLFAGSGRLFGIPLIVVWLFGNWLALIAAAMWFSRRLDPDGDGAHHVEEAPPLERSDPAAVSER